MAAALVLTCLAAPLAEAVDWCYPKLAATLEQPCPSKEQCCAIWVRRGAVLPLLAEQRTPVRKCGRGADWQLLRLVAQHGTW